MLSTYVWSNSAVITHAQLIQLFGGKDIFFDLRENSETKGWDSAHFRFLDNGNVVGYLFSADYLSTKSPRNDVDNGAWEVSGSNICIVWSEWENSEQHCYQVYHDNNVAISDKPGIFNGEFDPAY